MKARVLIPALLCAAVAAACPGARLAPVTDPSFSSLESDERALWNRSAEQAKRIDESGFLYDDSELETYVNAVARKLEPAAVYERIPFTVKVIRDPHLNAFCLANGAVYLHTGILAAMENEAQLATVLGHEMAHATNRHAINWVRDAKSTSAVMAAVFVTTGGLGAVFGPVASASLYGYSRDNEREADREGFLLTARAGYDTAESVKVFEQLKREIEATKIKEPFFFGTHPRIMERIESYRELIAARPTGERPGVTNAGIFQERTKKLLLDNVRLDLQAGRFERAASTLERYTGRYPGEADAYYLLGEANRLQRDGEHDRKAEENYRKALSLDAGHADSHKMLGIMLFKAGDRAAAKEHLGRYLLLNAGAPDRAYIEQYLRDCETGPEQNGQGGGS